MHVPKSLWTKPVGGNLETSREWSAKPHCCSGTKRRGSASGWTSVQSEHTWEARTKPSIVLELCLPASHAFCSHSLLSPEMSQHIGIFWPALCCYLLNSASYSLFPAYVFVSNTTLRGWDISSQAVVSNFGGAWHNLRSSGTGHRAMQNVHPRATMGWPYWAKEGLEMISQQVSSYSATNVTHTPIQVIRGSTWRLKQRKPTEMDNSRINHLTISTPILSSHLQLLCFPLFTLNEQLSTWEDLQCGFQDEITKQKQKGQQQPRWAPHPPGSQWSIPRLLWAAYYQKK